MTAAQAGPASGPAFVTPALSDDAQVWLVRHGETQWSASGRHTSTTDLPLTDAGRRQAAALREVFSTVTPALVLSSPRQRAVETARLAGLEVDEVTEDLAEWRYGAFEGRATAEIRAESPTWSLWRDGVPGGELQVEVEQRADRVLERAVSAVAGGPVVLVGHGHFSRVLGARWIGLPVSGGAHLLLGTAATCLLGAQYGVSAIVAWNIANPVA